VQPAATILQSSIEPGRGKTCRLTRPLNCVSELIRFRLISSHISQSRKSQRPMYPVTPCQGSSNRRFVIKDMSHHQCWSRLPTGTEQCGLDTQAHVLRMCTYLKTDRGGDSIGFSSESSIHRVCCFTSGYLIIFDIYYHFISQRITWPQLSF